MLRLMATRLGAAVKTEPAAPEGTPSSLASAILKGPALMISEIHAQIRSMMSLHNTQAAVAMMESVYQTMKNVVDNLAPSEKERLEKERRMEELEKLRRQLEDQEISLEAALKKFENIAVAAADRALLDANMAREAQPKV